MSSTPDLDAERCRNIAVTYQHYYSTLFEQRCFIEGRRSPTNFDKAAQYWILGAESVGA